MMDNILSLLPDFENLLRTKSFAELTPSEKSVVLKFMTTEEYDAMKNSTARVIVAFTEEEKYLSQDKYLESALTDRLSKKEAKPYAGRAQFFSFILDLKIPVYQAVILLILGLFLFPKSDTQIVTKISPVSRVDTVFVEKHVIGTASEKYNNRTSNIYPVVKKHISNQFKGKIRPVSLYQNSPFLADIVTHFQNEKTGRPIESDPNLYWRLVTVQSMSN
jgi:hypothetical protein